MEGQQTVSPPTSASPASPNATGVHQAAHSLSSTSNLAEISGFDEERLKESLIAVSSDANEALELLLETYLPDADSLLEQIRRSIEALDFGNLKLAAHTLKSSSALMGMMALSALCQQIEQQARAQDSTSLATLGIEAEIAHTHGRQLLLSYQPN